MLKEWKQDSTFFRSKQTEQQEQLECVFYQVQETTDKAVKDNHERYIDRVEDLKSGVSYCSIKKQIFVFFPVVALRLRVLRHALDQLPRLAALVAAVARVLQIAKALLHRVHVEVAQLAISYIFCEQIGDLAPFRLAAGIHLQGEK